MDSVFAMLSRPAMSALMKVMAEPVTLHVEGVDISARGVFVAEFESLDVDAGVPVSTVQPMLEVASFDVPVVPTQGDEVTVRGQRYMIVNARPVGHDFIKLMLHRK